MGGSPYIGMLLAAGFNFAPVNYALCDGRLIQISENTTLFVLLGTTFGGDGINTFGLPDLRGRTPIHFGGGYVMGQMAGVETVTLTVSELPAHPHAVNATGNNQTTSAPNNNFLAAGASAYTAAAPNSALANGSITISGSSVPHENLQPFQTLNWVISLYGIFPSQG